MNYSSFCDYLFASLMNHLGPDTTITKETVRKNNDTLLDVFIIRMPNVTSSPVVYLQPLYTNYQNGSSIEKIAEAVADRLNKEIPLSQELAAQVKSFSTVHDRIAFKLVSKKENEELLKDLPWVPFLDLAVIFYLHLGVSEERLISTLIHKNHAKQWNLSTEELYRLAKTNTPKLCPVHIGHMEHLVFGWDEDKERFVPCDIDLPKLHVLTNECGLNGASTMLYEGIIKDFAECLESDLVIFPSSIHEVLILADPHDRDYGEFRQMVLNVNAEDVPKEDILSDQLYLYRREDSKLMRWEPCECSDNAESYGTQSL